MSGEAVLSLEGLGVPAPGVRIESSGSVIGLSASTDSLFSTGR